MLYLLAGAFSEYCETSRIFVASSTNQAAAQVQHPAQAQQRELGAGDTEHRGPGPGWAALLLELQTIHRFSQSWRTPLLGPSPVCAYYNFPDGSFAALHRSITGVHTAGAVLPVVCSIHRIQADTRRIPWQLFTKHILTVCFNSFLHFLQTPAYLMSAAPGHTTFEYKKSLILYDTGGHSHWRAWRRRRGSKLNGSMILVNHLISIGRN